jgi:integrase
VDYRFRGKRKTLAVGAFADVGVAAARDQRDAAKRSLRDGIDPSELRRQLKTKEEIASEHTFAKVAERWFDARKSGWVEAYQARVWSRIQADIIPAIGEKPIDTIEPEDLLAALRRIERRGAVETARRVKNHVKDVFAFAKSDRLVKVNPAEELTGALATPSPSKRRTALRSRDLPTFLTDLANYDGEARTALAIEFTLLTFVRTNELRFARRDEFEDLKGTAPLWRIPAERMKMRNEHLVPLAPRAVAVLEEIMSLAARSELLFPAATVSGVMSENTMLFALYRMGYHQRATIHGFRGLASTILNEHGFNRDWIERQLAHVERDQIRAAYNAAEWLPQRRKMMRWWADFLKSGGRKAIPRDSVAGRDQRAGPVSKRHPKADPRQLDWIVT